MDQSSAGRLQPNTFPLIIQKPLTDEQRHQLLHADTARASGRPVTPEERMQEPIDLSKDDFASWIAFAEEFRGNRSDETGRTDSGAREGGDEAALTAGANGDAIAAAIDFMLAYPTVMRELCR